MRVCSAPGRAGVIGNPADMYGGSVLSCSIAERAYVQITEASRLELETQGETFIVRGEDDLRQRADLFDIARAILSYLRCPDLKCRISYRSDIPVRAGVAGSTALTVAMLHGLLEHQGTRIHRYRLAEMARHIELNFLRVVCGYQDAYMCTFGGLNYMDFRGKEFYRQAEAELYATIEPLHPYIPRLPFVLAHTGVQHSSGAVHKPIRERWLEGEQKVRDAYVSMSRLALEGKKALLQEDWYRLGRLMNQNHALQRDLGGSGESNERLIGVALEHGALGAKLAGAGDGGTIIALHLEPAEMIAALKEAGAERVFLLEPCAGVQTEDMEALPEPKDGMPPDDDR